jgi:diacylglycerol kinase (ATP)
VDNKIRLILNPTAGLGRSVKVLSGVRSLLDSKGIIYDVAESKWPGHAIEIARQSADLGYRVITAIGGDGTVGEVANGILESGVKGVRMAVIPAGTGNDFVGGNRLFEGWEDAACALASSERVKNMDVLSFRDASGYSRFVTNSVGTGFDAYVVKRVAGLGPRKIGHLSYMLEALRGLFVFKPGRFRVSVDGSDNAYERVWLFAVVNSERFGGGMRVSPGASSFDGKINVCFLSDVSRFQIVRLIMLVRSGRHVGRPGVNICEAQEIQIDAPEGFPCHVDGDTVDVTYPVKVAVVPGALSLIAGER